MSPYWCNVTVRTLSGFVKHPSFMHHIEELDLSLCSSLEDAELSCALVAMSSLNSLTLDFCTKLTDKLLHKLLYKTDTAAVTFYAAKAAPPLHHPIKFNKNRREFKEDNLQNGVLSTFTDGGNAGASGKKSDAKYHVKCLESCGWR